MNIVDLVKNYATNEMISKASSFLGENEGGVSKAVSGLIPALLGGLAGKATASEAGAEEVYQTAKAANDGGILGNLGSLFGNADILSRGTGLFNSLFGGKANSIIDAIANFAGIKSSSSGSLISLLLPLITGVLGKKAADDNLDASGLSRFLGEQKSNIQSALPAGLGSIGSLLGFDGIRNEARETVEEVRHTTTPTRTYTEDRTEKGGGMKWLLPLLLLATLGLALWYFMRKGGNNTDGTATTDTTTTVAVDPTVTPDTTTVVAPSRTLTEVVLPGDVKLQAYPGGVEDQLIIFIQSDEYKNATEDQLKDRWFNFDDLNFEFGTTNLTAASKRQLDNIVVILKAFPDAKVKIGAYTDKKGDDAANLKLSQDRANAVKAALDAAGVKAQITGAEGYGEKFATVDENASDKEREADRKTAIRLAK